MLRARSGGPGCRARGLEGFDPPRGQLPARSEENQASRGTDETAARRLYISLHTVNTHLRRVFAKLGVPNRAALLP
jgi:hypothetical protein